MSYTKEELAERQRKWNRECNARKRKELAEQGIKQYVRLVKTEHFPLMDARLAELNKTGV